MKLLYHLSLFDIVIAAFNAFENDFQHPALESINPPDVTNFSHKRNSQTATNVESYQDRSNSLLEVDNIHKHKRYRDSSDYLSSWPHSDLQDKRQNYQPTSSNAQVDHFLNDGEHATTTPFNSYNTLWNNLLPGPHSNIFGYPLTTMLNESPSSNPYITGTHTSSSDVAQQFSESGSNMATNDHLDFHQSHMSTNGEPQGLHHNTPPSVFEVLRSIQTWLFSDDDINNTKKEFFPNYQTSPSSQGSASNWCNLSRLPMPEASDLKNRDLNQVSQPKQNLRYAASELALLPPEISSVEQNKIKSMFQRLALSRRDKEKPNAAGPTPPSSIELLNEDKGKVLTKYFRKCHSKRIPIFKYIGEKYNLEIRAYVERFTSQRFIQTFPIYLLYVEMINTIIPGNLQTREGMESAWESYASLAQYFADPYTPSSDAQFLEYIKPKVDCLQHIAAEDLLWCFLEVWLYYKRFSLFSKIKLRTAPRMIQTSFKNFFNDLFVSYFDKFSVRLVETYMGEPLPIHRAPDTVSHSIFPQQEQFGLIFDDQALFCKDRCEPYEKLLQNLLEKAAKFPGVLVYTEDKILQLAIDLHAAKLKFQKGAKDRDLILRKSYKKIRLHHKTWLNYFDKTYNLQTLQFYNRFNAPLIQTILPLYLFFVEMINVIVPRTDLTRGGMTSAFNLFRSFLKSCLPDGSEENNATHWKIKLDKMNHETFEIASPILWRFLQHWMREERSTLDPKVSYEQSPFGLQSQFKALLVDIWILSFDNLSETALKLTPSQKKDQ